MGYQESILYFRRKNTLLNQIGNLKKMNKENMFLSAYTILEIKKSFTSGKRRFRKGQIFLHIGGERSHQRSLRVSVNTLGIERAKRLVPIEEVADNKEVFESRFQVIKKI